MTIMIEIVNLREGDLFEYPIVFLFGRVVGESSKQVEIVTNNRVETSIQWSVRNSYFKAFVELTFGRNELRLKTNDCQLDIVVYRRRPVVMVDKKPAKLVRVLYVLCSDQTVAKDELQTGLDRLELNVKLLQTFIAEQLFKSNGIRKTITFKSDDRIVEIFRSKLTLSDVRRMRPNELFIHLAEEVKSQLYESGCKFIAVLSFTTYRDDASLDEIKNDLNKVGYCALGAEWLAVYGTPCLFTWSDKLENLESCFRNDSIIGDSPNYGPDSAFRNTHSACYSTTLGSLLHEFSHVLDLGHNSTGIMARGFDDLFKFFIYEYENCSCYTIGKSTNPFIDRLAAFSSESGDRNFNEVFVSKCVTFKSNLSDIDAEYFKSNDIIYKMRYFKKSTDRLSERKTISIPFACQCQGKCVYTPSNLNILFHHKWINSRSDDDKNTDLFEINCVKNSRELFSTEIKSVFEMGAIEVITLKRSLTLVDLASTKSNSIEVSKLNEFSYTMTLRLDEIKCELSRLGESSDLELFLTDINGNILKRKLIF